MKVLAVAVGVVLFAADAASAQECSRRYHGEEHTDDWDFYTIDANSKGMTASDGITIYDNPTHVCGHDGARDERGFYCEEPPAEWRDVWACGNPEKIILSVNPDTVDEDDGSPQITVTATLDVGVLASSASVTVSVGSGTATAGTDFGTVNNFTLTIPANSRSGTATFSLTLNDDNVHEGDETVTVSGAHSDLPVDSATLTIAEDDTVSSKVTLSLNPDSVSEGGGQRMVTVTGTLDEAASASPTSVSVSVENGTAEGGTDFDTVTGFTLTIPARATSGTATFRLTPTDDSLEEGDETLTVSGTANGLDVESATLTITDNDEASTKVTLSLDPDSISEGAGQTTIRVTGTLDGAVRTSATSVSVSVGGGTARAGTDYGTVPGFTLTIAANDRTGTATFDLTPTDDGVAEPAETLTVSGTANGLDVDSATLTIDDDDAASAKVILSVDPPNVSEGDGQTPVTVTGTLDGSARTGPTSVTVSVSGGTATAGTDFDTVNNFTLTIPAEATSGTASFNLTPTDDRIYEGPETVTVSGSTNGLDVDTATLTITENDAMPAKVILSVDPSIVSEGAGRTTVTVKGTLDGAALTSATSVTVSVDGDTATAATDFGTVNDFTLTIPAESMSGTATFALTPTNDTMYESAETVTVSGETTGLTVDPATLTITDDDGAPTKVILSVEPATVSEGDGETTVTVTGVLDGAALTTVTSVTVSVTGGTATAGTDFDTVDNFTLTINDGATSGTAMFALTPTDDEEAEGSETLTVSGDTTNLNVDSTTLTIIDNDAASTQVILSVVPSAVSEGADETTVTVTGTLNGAAFDSATSVTVSVDGNTATAGTDFNTVNDFTLTINGGATRGNATFRLTPIDDKEAEGAETLTISGRTEGLSVTAATLTLTDNDAGERKNRAPEFTRDSFVFDLLQKLRGNRDGLPLGYLTAIDPDDDPISYFLTDHAADRFDVHRSNGMVVYRGPGEDPETGPPLYELEGVARDPAGLQATAPVMVKIRTDGRQPIAVDDTAETPEDTAVLIDVLANDVAPVGGGQLQVLALTQPSHGVATLVAGGVRYMPSINYHGPDSFTYTAGDGSGLSARATVSVTVLPVGEAPTTVGVIPDQMLQEGADPVSLDLAPYFADIDGDRLMFEAMSSDLEVVTVAVTGTMLYVTPVVTGAAMVTVTAVDPYGLTAQQVLGVNVGDDWVRVVMTDGLAALGRGHLSSVRQTVGRRLETGGEAGARLQVAGQQLTPGAFGAQGVGSLARSQAWLARASAVRQRGASGDLAGTSADPFLQHSHMTSELGGTAGGWDQALQGTDVLMAFGEGGQTATGAPGGNRRWTVWGQGDLQTFRGRSDAIGGYEGNLRSGYVGVDAQVSRQWLLGVAMSRSGGSGMWQAGSSTGQLTTTLTTVHPYVRWGSGDTTVMAVGGVGRGTATNLRDLTGRQGTSTLNLGLGLVEARRRLATLGSGVQIGVRGEASWARLATGPGDETVDDLRAEVRRLRGGVEVTRRMARPSGLTVTPFGAVSARRDRGGGQTGTGLELAGGIRLRNGRVQVEAQGRRLILHSATGYAEQGVSVAASVGAGPRQEGLTLSVQPTWGVAGAGAETLWQDELRTRMHGVDLNAAGVDARIGYGLRLPGGSLVTPFGGYGEREGMGRRLQLGARLGTVGQVRGGFVSPVELEFAGERYSRPGSDADHRVSLLGIVTFSDRAPAASMPAAAPMPITPETAHGTDAVAPLDPAVAAPVESLLETRTAMDYAAATAVAPPTLTGAGLAGLLGDQSTRPPAFSARSYAFELPGHWTRRRVATPVGAVMARDPAREPVVYALVAGDGRLFSIEPSSGTIRWVGAVNGLEPEAGQYELTVAARNTRRLMAEVPVVVTIGTAREESDPTSPPADP